jgi:hypothetical protein
MLTHKIHFIELLFQFNSSCLLHVSNILCSSSGRLYCTCGRIRYIFHVLCSPSTFLAYDKVYVVSVADTSTEFISHLHSVEMLVTETLLELHSSSVAEGLTQFVVSASSN